MKTFFSVLLSGSVSLSALFPAMAQDTQTFWTSLPPFDSQTSPAVAAHFDGRVYMAGVAFNGLVAVSSANAPGGWSAWRILGPAPCSPQPCFDTAFRANPATQPVVVLFGSVLHVFARGMDDNLYVIRKNGAGNWETEWQALTTDGQVGGRISVAFRDPIGVGETLMHVLFATGFQSVEYRPFALDGAPRAGGRQWCNVIEGVLASDGDTRLCAVLRTDHEIWVDTKTGAWPWQEEFTRTLTTGTNLLRDLSSAVYYANAFQVACTYPSGPAPRGGTEYTVLHLRIRPGQWDDQYARVVYRSVLDTGFHPLPELAVYRNKLICAWADEVGNVRYSRWDMADPVESWSGNEVLDPARQTFQRPALGAYNRLPLANNAQYALPNFGNDLLAGMTETASSRIFTMNLSKSALVRYLDGQVSVYNYALPGGCTNQGEPNAPVLVPNLFTDGRPVLTELGVSMWMLPEWLGGHIFKDAGEQGCLNSNPSGRFPGPCATTKYPVIVKPSGGIYICSGVWVNHDNNYLRIWEEYGHSLAGMLGFGDRSQDNPNGVPPTSLNETLTGIALADLTAGFNMFAEQCVYGSDATGRCRGFVDICCPANYDAGSVQHSFMYIIFRYIGDGDLIRRMMRDDLAAGVDLLQRKYNWVRQHIYRGVEFRKDGEPLRIWNDDCGEATRIVDGFFEGTTETAANDGASSMGLSAGSPDVWYAYTAPCSGTLSLNTCGSDYDTVLSVHSSCPGTVANELAASDDCSAPCSGTDSCLTLAVTAGTTYWIRLSGYNGARGDFMLSVANSCTLIPLGGASPDAYDDQLPAGETRNDNFANASVISQPVEESLLVQSLSLEDLNFDGPDDVDFFTVQIPTPETECCPGEPNPDSIQGQLRLYVHPRDPRPFAITFYRANGTIALSTNAGRVYLDCPRELFPDGRVTFSLQDYGCRNEYDVSLGYHRCDMRIYPPWFLEYDPPLFRFIIPERPEMLRMQFPMDPEVWNAYLNGTITTPPREEYLRLDREASGPFVLDILLPRGGDMQVLLLDEAGEIIGAAEAQSGLGTASLSGGPAGEGKLTLVMEDLPPGTYFLRIEALDIGTEYILNAPTCRVPPPGLVSWWGGDGETTDRVSGFDGVLEFLAGYGPGLVREAFFLDGDSSMRVDSRPELLPETFTVAAWINPASYEGNRVLEKGGWRVNGGYGLEFNAFDSQGIRFVVWDSFPQVIDSDEPVPLGVWTHVTGTFDGEVMRLFVNGVEQRGARRASMIFNDAPLTIGRASDVADLFFHGLIDEVMLFGRALEPGEILRMVRAGSAGLCSDCPLGVPTLDIRREGELLELVWPHCAGFVLEQTSLLGDGERWRPIEPPYPSDGTHHHVEIVNSAEYRFFRLRKP